ncbi:hypothetical protein H490_0104040 [Leucobacter sp. UCD-THU]|uniref:Uncharacterized protein n=1 Tax=Leucobacter muris TaxID=1935379 RepID=A0ABX5QDH2_9MICO|nr:MULTISPECIES: hypothetical protein [Leucobacter]EYT56044.1 hypothetical protein H490_0104040 [Leucobacter sp. UCD-THU]QAB17106.1 hypothetical protein Leucomu_03495 [Leucobacter muris]QAB18413.1 hypothetical protein Leucomu_11245 [Leucobacter muris]
MDWTDHAWRILCLLAVAAALTAFTPLWWTSPIVQGLSVVPGLLVMLILVIASCAPSTGSWTSRAGSTGTSRGGRDE